MLMYLINNNGVPDAAINLALEEYCLRNLDSANDYLLFYINAPAVIVGKHQNPYQEINYEYIKGNKIKVVRRISGGGAVYHDYGNLNFTFITDFANQGLDYFKKLVQPIVNTLIRLNVAAEITKKNSIFVAGVKISGTSQYTNMKRMLSHGTLLFDSEIDVLNSVLDSNLEVIKSKGIESIHSEVTNILDHLSRPVNMETFFAELQSGISDSFGELKEFQLTAEDWDSVNRLSDEKYKSWEWTFGKSPEFTVRHKLNLSTNDVDVRVCVRHGIIKDVNIDSNHFESAVIRKDLAKFVGERYALDGQDIAILSKKYPAKPV